jgi:hypothetical protein
MLAVLLAVALARSRLGSDFLLTARAWCAERPDGRASALPAVRSSGNVCAPWSRLPVQGGPIEIVEGRMRVVLAAGSALVASRRRPKWRFRSCRWWWPTG